MEKSAKNENHEGTTSTREQRESGDLISAPWLSWGSSNFIVDKAILST